MEFESSGFNLSMKLAKNLWLNESKNENLLFSSFSIHTALGLLASGATGKTLNQILELLNFKTLDELNTATSKVTDALSSISTVNGEQCSGGPELSSANSVWIDQSCTLKPSYSEIASSIYKADAKVVDFKTKARDAAKEVNQWVEDKTKGLIKDLLHPDSLSKRTRVVLVNALYFKGSWVHEFDLSKTSDAEFHHPDGSSTVNVPFMTNDYMQHVCCYGGFKVLQLPYSSRYKTIYGNDDVNSRRYENINSNVDSMSEQSDDDSNDDVDSIFEQSDDEDVRFRKSYDVVADDTQLSMYIILPDENDGLGDLIEKVSSDPDGFLHSHIFPLLHQPRVRMGEFRIPKFNISFDFEASRVLKELGMVLPFDPDQGELTEMVTTSTGNNLYVAKVIQKCYIEVEEGGTTAVAATAISDEEDEDSSDSEEDLPEPVDFVADHPFMFFIRDDKSGAVLFTGLVLNPLLTDQ